MYTPVCPCSGETNCTFCNCRPMGESNFLTLILTQDRLLVSNCLSSTRYFGNMFHFLSQFHSCAHEVTWPCHELREKGIREPNSRFPARGRHSAIDKALEASTPCGPIAQSVFHHETRTEWMGSVVRQDHNHSSACLHNSCSSSSTGLSGRSATGPHVYQGRA